MQHDRPIHILVVEDTQEHRDIIADQLEGCDPPFMLTFVQTCAAAMNVLGRQTFDCMLIDHNLPDDTGAHLLARAKYELLTTPVIAMSTSGDPSVALDDMLQGSATFVRKRDAFQTGALRQAILSVIRQQDLRDRMRYTSTNPQMLERLARLFGNEDDPARDAVRYADHHLQHVHEAAVAMVDAGMVLIENRSRIIFVNPAFKRLLGLDALDELPGYPDTTIDHVFRSDAADRLQQQDSNATPFEAVLRSVSGEHVPVMITQTALGAADVLCAVTDLRQIKQQQIRIEHANRQLSRSARILRAQNRRLRDLTETAHRFVENVAHEFRTPLAVIHEFASIINDGLGGPTTTAQREYLGFVTSASLELARMVDDFLDSSKLKAGTLRVERRPHQVAAMLSTIRPIVTSRAHAKQIRLIESVPAGLPSIFADLEKAGRALVNLVINAIKFSPDEAEVRVAVTHRGDAIEIAVTDQGPGLQPEELRIIGERFRQYGEPMKGSTKGFGLGINIAKELIWLNLGQMHVASTPGEGATFSFTLPIHHSPAILARFFTMMRRHVDEPHLAALSIDCGNVDPDAVHTWLTSQCHPLDLILPDPSINSIIVVGQPRRPEQWVRQLRASWERSDQARDRPTFGTIHVMLRAEGSPDDVERVLRDTSVDSRLETPAYV